MSLGPGSTIGPFKIQSLIGKGGMGEVFAAVDTRLERSVAIKILPPELSADPELRARFEREARAISNLTHPHICTLYDIGRENGTDYLVMERLEGQTLAERLRKGPLPLEQALEYGIQIAAALDRAHRAGIVHRDLKPANVMLTKTGVKLLDFGLAKLQPNLAADVRRLTSKPADTGNKSEPPHVGCYDESAPTLLQKTTPGMILGTLQYMSPEQVEGAAVDHRADIFAFGCVLYEMISGKKAFEGKSAASVMAAILEREPRPVHSHQPLTPATLDAFLNHCLAKSPDDRWQSAHDLKLELDLLKAAQPIRTSARERKQFRLLVVVVGLLLTSALFALLRPEKPDFVPDVVHVRSSLPQGLMLSPGGGPVLAFSPTGKLLAYRAAAPGQEPALYLQDLVSGETEKLPGTDGGDSPFFSPDSEWLGFTIRSQSKLMRIAVRGGQPEFLTSLRGGGGVGAVWSPDGSIFFVPDWNAGLYRLTPDGAVTQIFGTDATNRAIIWPDMLPDGKTVIAGVWRGGTWDNSVLAAFDTVSRSGPLPLIARTSFARYSASGHLVYAQGQTLFAVPFDATTGQLGGKPALVHERIPRHLADGQAHFALSKTGRIAYPGPIGEVPKYKLAWVTADGRVKETAIPAGAIRHPAVSPDGKTIAATVGSPGVVDIYGFALQRNGARTLLSSSQDAYFPVWSRDGKWIVFTSGHKGAPNIFKVSAHGSAEETHLFPSPHYQLGDSFSRDDSILAFTVATPDSGYDIWLLDFKSTNSAARFLATAANEHEAQFHPLDDEWIAYSSDEGGQYHVQVCNRKTGIKYTVSDLSCRYPRWSPDGKRLYFWSDQKVTAVEIKDLEEGQFSAAATVVEQPLQEPFGVAPNGELLVVRDQTDTNLLKYLHIQLNWFSVLNQAFQTKE